MSLSLLCIRVTEPPLQNQPDFCKVYCLITDKLIWLVRIFSFNSWKYEQWNSSITLEKGQPIKSSFSRLNVKVQSLFCVMFVVHRFLPSVDKLCTEKAEVCSILPFAMILPKSWLWYFTPGYTNKEGFCARVFYARLHLCLFQRLLLTISPLKYFAANFLREGAGWFAVGTVKSFACTCCYHFYWIFSFVRRFLILVLGSMCLPKGTAVLERPRREWGAMFVVVFISLTADLQKLLHIVSS